MVSEAVDSPTHPPTTQPPDAWGKLRWAWRVVSVRLRFLVALGLAFAIITQWDVIRTYWDKVTLGAIAVDPALQAVSGETEYFCPMDPGVVSDWPGKCGICNMALVRRKRGEMPLLPEGVVARMQLAPYRLQLGGIQTSAVGYRPLCRELEGPGSVRSAESGENAVAQADVTLFVHEIAGLAAGQEALVSGATPEPLKATVRSIELPADGEGLEALVSLDVHDPAHQLRRGLPIRACLRVPVAQMEPFRSMPTNPPALAKGERRRVYRCAQHPDKISDAPGRCPTDQTALERFDLADNQRLRWWCPMHPEVTADRPGAVCAQCGGMKLVPHVISFNPPGEVLAVPETAVIDTGTKTVVYLERMPGTFDGVEVVLGPRCGAMYPVVRGLEAGQRVVTAGAFLVDAETRLSPGAAAGYFGAARSAPAPTAEAKPAPARAAAEPKLSPADQRLADRQRICPVTGKRLGSMGTPVRVEIDGTPVFLCCEGCEPALRKEPGRFLAKLRPNAHD